MSTAINDIANYIVSFTDTTEAPSGARLDCDYQVTGRAGVTHAMGMVVRDYLNLPLEDGSLDPEFLADQVAAAEQILEDLESNPSVPLAASTSLLRTNLTELRRTSAVVDFLYLSVVERLGELDPNETVSDPVMVSLLEPDVAPTLQNVLVAFLFRLESQGYRFNIVEEFARV